MNSEIFNNKNIKEDNIELYIEKYIGVEGLFLMRLWINLEKESLDNLEFYLDDYKIEATINRDKDLVDYFKSKDNARVFLKILDDFIDNRNLKVKVNNKFISIGKVSINNKVYNKNEKNILILSNTRDKAHYRYRSENLGEELSLKKFNVSIRTLDDIKDEDLLSPKTIILQTSHENNIIGEGMSAYSKANNIRLLYDFDDAIFHMDAIKLCENFYNNMEELEKYTSSLLKTMSICDGFIVSTLPLKKLIKLHFSGKYIFINENRVSKEMENIYKSLLDRNIIKIFKEILYKKHKKVTKKPSVNDNQKIIIGYFSGSKTHDRDFIVAESGLLKILEKHENVNLLIVGELSISEKMKPYEERIIRKSLVNYKDLPKLISRVDINIAPLEKNIFTDCKSTIKWMEAVMCNTPTLITKNEESKRIIRNNYDGILVEDNMWEYELDRIINDDFLRKFLVKNGKQTVKKYYRTKSINNDLIKYLRKK